MKAGFILLRVLSLAALALLAWKAFWGREELAVEASPLAREAEVIVLQDRSASMELPGGPGKTREELAGSVWAEVLEKGRRFTGPRSFSIKRYFFAENLVEDGSAGHLLRDGTRLRQALTEILSRKALRSLLIVSDGVTTDGLAPSYLLDWARNRNLRVNAVCSAELDLDLFDQAIQGVDCSPENPSSLKAMVSCSGSRKGPITVTLSIDGSRSAEARRGPRGLQEVVFRLPALAEGWHEYAVEAEAVEHEATALNNVFHGVFRVERESIVLIHDRPATEHVQLARFLRRTLAGKFTCLALAELREVSASLHRPSLVLLADVVPEKVPGPLREAWSSAQVPLLILGGEGLEGWVHGGLPDFPVAGLGATEFLGQGDRRPAVAVEAGAEDRGIHRESRVELPLDLLRRATLRQGARVVQAVDTDRGALPLLVSDRGRAPRFAVLLSDTTWKWALHPKGEIRRGYERFWSHCLDRLREERRESHPLALKLKPPGKPGEDLQGWVEATDPRTASPLANCRVAVDGDGLVVRPERGEDERRLAFRLRGEELRSRPPVLWLKAFAEIEGREVESERVPVAFRGSVEELHRVHPDPEALKRHTTGEEDGFSAYPGRSAAIDSLFREAPPRGRRSKLKRRETSLELLFAGMAVLFLGLEWWLERRLRAGSRP